MNTQQPDDAISKYSTALSLEPVAPPSNLLIKRSKAYSALSLWEYALNDADKVRSRVPYRFFLDGVFS